MPTKGLKKLVDIPNGLLTLRLRLSEELDNHHVEYAVHPCPAYVRYFVKPVDLCCARTILMALEANLPQ